MAKKRGSRIPISFARRCMMDLMHFSREMSFHRVSAEYQLDLSLCQQALDQTEVHISWFAIFIKAFAEVSQEFPELRQILFSFPWKYLYQYQRTVAMLAIEREVDGENMVMYLKIDSPEKQSLQAIHQQIQESKTVPIEENLSFRRFIKFNRFPFLLRRFYWWMGYHLPYFRLHYFGTYGVTGAGRGLRSLSIQSPLGVNFVFDKKTGLFRFFWDHRLFDGVIVADMLLKLQNTLNGSILAELKELRGECVLV